MKYKVSEKLEHIEKILPGKIEWRESLVLSEGKCYSLYHVLQLLTVYLAIKCKLIYPKMNEQIH